MTTVTIPKRIMMNEDVKKTCSSLPFLMTTGPSHKILWARGPRRRYTRSVNRKCNFA